MGYGEGSHIPKMHALSKTQSIETTLVYFSSVYVNLVTTEEKRLLFNDPDVLVNRLNRVENIVAILNATVRQLTTKNQQQAVTIQQQENMILQQQTSIQQQYTLNQQQEQTIKLLQSSANSIKSLGTTYIRWGRKQCHNNNTELVYSGYAGGGHYNNPGSAAEYVCLPPDPNYVKTSGSDYGRMYGGEFDSNFFASNSDNEDVPCALCRTGRASSVIMIPGKNTCYNGWKVEYHGYLASGLYNHVAASAYVCVDLNPEYIIGGVDQHLGKLFYEVLTKCGSLKCPPYINNYPLTCVVNLVTTEEKRLLLNDPDVQVNRLIRVENIVAILNATVRQLTTQNQQQVVTIQHQEKIIQQLQTSIQQQQTSIQQHEQKIKQLQSSSNSIQSFGTTYIRWGRKQCPNNKTELVYSGFSGGGYYNEQGSAAEYVCLPPDPNYVKTGGKDYAHMYGGEYDSNFFASNSHAEDVPCAVCKTDRATAVIMIPGKNTCYSGWNIEYHGYLASGDHNHAAASAFVCVDINPEYINGGVDTHYADFITSATADVNPTSTEHINPTSTKHINPTTADINPTPTDVNSTTEHINPTTVDINPAPTDVNPTTEHINPTTADINPTT
ncbi:unnamed protein product [Mytilus coruscus]|uniref:Uncharacterized protein n=1 Tax=Mytilus coruscus TaxID=42192 RepID=A0A6J8DEV0_MYTCO|nr:unnamed protein product [Mytilus coruscus]